MDFLQLFFIFSLSVMPEGYFLCERSIIMALIVRPARETDLPAIGELYGTVCDALQGKAYNPG